MGPFFVVFPHPRRGDISHFIEGLKEVSVEHFAAIRPIESFDIGVLVWLPRLDVADVDLMLITPIDEGLAQEFRTVVAADCIRSSSPFSDLVQCSSHPRRGKRRVEASEFSNREIIRRLGTSASQYYRLLDQTNYTKSIGQLLALLEVLECEVEFIVRDRRLKPTGS